MRQFYKMGESGFTLVELLAVLLMLALIAIAVPAAFKGGTQVWDKGDKHAEVMQNGLIGMEQMSRELRQAQYLTVAGTNHIEFIDRYDNYAQFAQGAKYLESGPPEELSLLAGPVDDLRFGYYRANGDIIPNPVPLSEVENIRSVLIQLDTVDSDEGNLIPLSSRVYMRNLVLKEYGDNPPPSDEEEPPPTYGGLWEFAIFGGQGVNLRQNLIVGDGIEPANVGSNGIIDLGNNDEIYGDLVHPGNPDDVIYQPGDIYVQNEVPNTFVLLPCVYDFTEFDKDGADETHGNGAVVTLDPGDYGALTLGNTSTLNLRSGDYYFTSITTGNNLTIVYDVSFGPDIRVFIEGQVDIGTNLEGSFSSEIVGGGAERIYFETHYQEDPLFSDPTEPAWSMGQGATFRGTVYAPFDDIGNENNAITDIDLQGSLYAGGWVWLHNSNHSDADVVYVPSNYLTRDGAYECD